MHGTSEFFDILASISFHRYPTIVLVMHLLDAVHDHGLLLLLLVDDAVVQAPQAAEKLRFKLRVSLFQVKVRTGLFLSWLFVLLVKSIVRRALNHFTLGKLLELSGLQYVLKTDLLLPHRPLL